MYKLLNSGFSRLIKNKIFWGIIILTFMIACFMLGTKYFEMQRYINSPYKTNYTEELFFSFIQIIGFLIAIFTSLFVGAEYSDGTIRNKIVVGHSRINIYLSNLIISTVVGIFIEVLYLLIILSIGIPIFGTMNIAIQELIIIIFDIVMIIVSYSSIFNFITIISSEITIATIGCLIVTIIMFMIGFNDGIINNFIPSGQAHQIAIELKRINANIEILPLYSLILIIFINFIGINLFNKKELK